MEVDSVINDLDDQSSSSSETYLTSSSPMSLEENISEHDDVEKCENKIKQLGKVKIMFCPGLSFTASAKFNLNVLRWLHDIYG